MSSGWNLRPGDAVVRVNGLSWKPLATLTGTPLKRDINLYKPVLIKPEGRLFYIFFSPIKCVIFFFILIALISREQII